MEEYTFAIFAMALAGITLSFGAWVVRAVKRDFVVTWWGVVLRADNAFAYWLFAAWHALGLVLVVTVAVATTLYYLLGALE